MNRSTAVAGIALPLLAAVVLGCGAAPGPSPSAGASASWSAAVTPTPAAASSPPSSSAASAPGPTPTPAAAFTLTSAAFHPSGSMPARFTCDGRDVSPAMAWTGTPPGTQWLVLLMDDPDAGEFAHWIAYAIAPTTRRLDEGAGAARSRLPQGTNDFGRVGYGGPCPPSGTHHYRFTLYALGAPLGLSGAPRADVVRAALARAQVLGTATLTAAYRR